MTEEQSKKGQKDELEISPHKSYQVIFLRLLRQLAIVDDLLRQIRKAILDLQEWNRDIQDADDWLTSSDGMKTLAASCMLIEAIGEGYRMTIDNGQLTMDNGQLIMYN